MKGQVIDHDSGGIRKRAPVDLEDDTSKRTPVTDKKVKSSAAEAENLEDDATKRSPVADKKAKSSAAGAEDLEDSDPAPGFEKLISDQFPLQDEDRDEEDPLRPLSHKEYVTNKIENENLPKGFVDVMSKAYILR
jgi:mannosyl-oligosaccharide alpha-1,2-mannosidase